MLELVGEVLHLHRMQNYRGMWLLLDTGIARAHSTGLRRRDQQDISKHNCPFAVQCNPASLISTARPPNALDLPPLHNMA